MSPDDVARHATVFALMCLAMLLCMVGFNVAAEVCDATEGWVCGVADDGYHDGHFDWRHGVLPF